MSQVATAFVEARRRGAALPDFPGPVPADLSEAYRIQDNALALDGRHVAGWKVGRINPPQGGVNRLAGPIFADQVTHEANPAMQVFADGFGAAEAEFLLRIGTAPDPARTHWTIEDACRHIDAVHIGIEIASSPFPGINAGGATVTIADYGNNNGLVIGAAVPDWREARVEDWPVSLLIDGVQAGAATAAAMLDGPFGAAAFLFGHLAGRGISLSPGQWISSGAVTGVHQVEPGQAIEATFGSGRSVRCTIKAR